jgi:low temperature requirement protein LtrA
MLVTLCVEIVLAIYTIWRYKLTVLARLVVAALAMLAIFQLSEYFVCTGYGVHAEEWSRLGFIAITTLPPLGLHILHVLAGKRGRRLVYGSYATMLGFIGFFLLYKTAFIGHQCTGNYVIFQIGDRMAGLYGLYYYGWLFAAMALGLHWAGELKGRGGQAVKRLETVRALVIGYLVFLVPTAVANTIRPETRRGIPSVMCGFAVLFALILTLYIMPRMAKRRRLDLTKHSD